MRGHRRRAAHPAHARHRHRQDVHRVSDRVETVSRPLESHRRQDASRTRRPRILFLADRNILANQAYNAFSAFPEDALVRIAPEDIRKKGKVPKNGSLFFTIFQTFMSGPPRTASRRPISAIIRRTSSISSSLTSAIAAAPTTKATGAASWIISRPPCSLASPPRPSAKTTWTPTPISASRSIIYSLKDGINDGFLTPFQVKQIQTTLDYYVFTPDDTVVEGEIEAGKLYDETGFQPDH